MVKMDDLKPPRKRSTPKLLVIDNHGSLTHEPAPFGQVTRRSRSKPAGSKTDNPSAAARRNGTEQQEEMITCDTKAKECLVNILRGKEKMSRNVLLEKCKMVIDGVVLRALLKNLDQVVAPCGTVKFRQESKNKQAFHYWVEAIESNKRPTRRALVVDNPGGSTLDGKKKIQNTFTSAAEEAEAMGSVPSDGKTKVQDTSTPAAKMNYRLGELQVIKGMLIAIKENIASLNKAVTRLCKEDGDEYIKQLSIISKAFKKMEVLTSEKLAKPPSTIRASEFSREFVEERPSSSVPNLTNIPTTSTPP